MGRVGAIAQGVDDPHIQAFEEGKARFGNTFHIRRISERAEAKAERGDLAVLEIERHRLDRPARTFDAAEPAGGKAQLVCHRRIRTSVRGLKNIRESLADDAGRRLVHVQVETATHDQAKGPQIVDAVGVIGVGMAQKDAVEPLHAGVEQLLAQVGRSVDENGSCAAGPEALEQHRAAAAAVLRVRRIAVAPPLPDSRHAAGRAAAQDGQPQRQCDDPTACGSLPPSGGSLEKKLSVLARVAAASASGSIPRASATTAAVATTKAGSLRRPRCGIGAR